MYHHLSRSLYRRLAAQLQDDPGAGGIVRQRQRLLDACEATMLRLATDPNYFAHPARFLFGEIRPLYVIADQLRVRLIVERHLAIAAVILARQQSLVQRECDALTRRGTPCRREPVEGGRFCPSHRHLEPVLDRSATAV